MLANEIKKQTLPKSCTEPKSYLDIVAEIVSHNAAQDVERDVGASVAHMRIVIDSGTACVPGNFVGIHWNKLVFIASECVENTKFWLFVCCTHEKTVSLH